MDNFSIFNKDHITTALEPFLPGATDHITPIAYQAWTPDVFLFLFRTTDSQKVDHFFVLIAYDYLTDAKDEVASIVKQWKDLKVLEFIPSLEPTSVKIEAQISKIYKAILTRVAIPSSLGYWANNIVITKDSDIDAEMANFTSAIRDRVREFLEKDENRRIVVYQTDRGETELFIY